MYRPPIVPSRFVIPKGIKLSKCDILPLTVEHAKLDYDAVMDNLDEDGNTLYPTHTLFQNRIDLGYHQKEFQKRASFTYTILNKKHDECLGCLYIYPCDHESYDVEVDFWIRHKYKGDEREIWLDIQQWIKDIWPWENVKYIPVQ